MSRRRAFLIVLMVVLLFTANGPGRAVDSLQLEFEDVTGEGLAVRGVRLRLDWTGDGQAALRLSADSVLLPEPAGSLGGLELVCDDLRFRPEMLDCTAGHLMVASGAIGAQRMAAAFRYHLAGKQLEATLDGIRYLGGRTRVEFSVQNADWQLALSAQGLALSATTAVTARYNRQLPVLTGEGRVTLLAKVHGQGERLTDFSGRLRVQSPEFSDAEGRIAAEELDSQLAVQARPDGAAWRATAQLELRKGGLYVDPVYLAVDDEPVKASVAVVWDSLKRQLQVERFEYLHPDSVSLGGQGVLNLADGSTVPRFDLAIREAAFPSAYATYLQPWLNGTVAGYLDGSGRLSGSLRLRDGALQALDLALQGLSFDDREGRFGLHGMDGELHWADDRVTRISRLSWQDGHVYRIAIGASGVTVETTANRFVLADPVRLPVLDGELEVESFALETVPGASPDWSINGLLTPLSMQAMTAALGWPEFGGKLSGVIPDVRYRGGELSVGGVLLVRVFDGDITLRNVLLQDPFGAVPRLQLDAGVDNLDLRQLTQTFSFGRIEGRLGGYVNGLQMESWRPVAFDARLMTPEGDRSRHRISQKAVDSISNIGGGGVSGALSRSFLRFLEDFPYHRLGFSCRLQNGVCEMDGVERAGEGYYLVKGRFLPPRLDVVGFASRVDWDSLVSQVIAVTRQQNVVVQ